MRHVAVLLLVLSFLFVSPTPAYSDTWSREARGDTPYLNRAQQLSSVHRGNVAAAGYLGGNNRTWDWLVTMYDGASGKVLWRDLIDEGSDRAHAVSSTRLGSARVITVAAGRIGGKYAVRAYRAETGEVLWRDSLEDIGDAYTVDATRERTNVTGTAVRFDPALNRLALHIVTRSYDTLTGDVIWERAFVEGDAVRVTGKDPIDTAMSRNWYAIAAWVHETERSGSMLRVLDNKTSRPTFVHRFDEEVTVTSVAQYGRVTVVGGETETEWGNVARIWAFDGWRGKELWNWAPQIERRADAENSSVEDVVAKSGFVYAAVNHWIHANCQSGPCRFGERRGTVRAALIRNGDLRWEVDLDCAIRDLAANSLYIAAVGVSTVQSLASPSMCGSALNRFYGTVKSEYGGRRGDIYAVAPARSYMFVAGESHEPYPSAINFFVGGLDNPR